MSLFGVLTRIRRRIRRPQNPRLSVILPVYNVAPYLSDCLDSLLNQTLHDLEIIAVDDGSTDRSPEILASYAGRDSRLRVLWQPNQGQGQARNLALQHASGDLLTFCDSDDTVPLEAYARMARVLDRTGSDFVLGTARRFRPRGGQSRCQEHVHRRDHLATTIDEFPVAMHDIIACNRMYRSSFWRERIGSFPVGVAYEDHVPMLASYVRAERFDVLAQVTYNWRVREEQTSTGQQKADLQNLKDRIQAKVDAEQMLLAEASDKTYDAWVARCLGIDFVPYLRHGVNGDAEYRTLLSATYQRFFDRASEETLRSVDHSSKIRGWLCAQQRWSELAEAQLYFQDADEVPPIEVRDGRAFALPERVTSFAEMVPGHLWECANHETELEGGLRAAQWKDSETLLVSGYAVVPGISTDAGPPQITGRLVSIDKAVTLEVPAVAFWEPQVDMWVGHRNARYSHSAFEVEISATALRSHLPETTTWALEIGVTHGQLHRTGHLHRTVVGSAAHGIRRHRRDIGDGWSLVPMRDPSRGFIIHVAQQSSAADRPARKSVCAVRMVDNEIEIEFTAEDEPPPATAMSLGGLVVRASESPGEEPRRARFPLRTSLFGRAPTALPRGHWVLRSMPGLEAVSVSAALLRTLPLVLEDTDHRVEVRRSPSDGGLRLLLEPAIPLTDASPAGQAQLQREYWGPPRRKVTDPRRDVLFLSTDPRGAVRLRAIATAMADLRPNVRRFWSVRSAADEYPLGCTPVVVGSRWWYYLLREAAYLCSDGEPPSFLQRQPDQRHLRVVAGRPTDSFGHPLWRALNWDQVRIDHEVARRNQLWDAVAAMDASASEVVRTSYGYSGQVFAVGDPGRNALSNASLPKQGRRARMELDIAEDARVILYAPTGRPQHSKAVGVAQVSPELNLEQITSTLPDGDVLLQYGYANNRNPGDDALARLHPAVRDVTSHPDLLTVMAAADVAILDYSGLRFDWAAMGRPTVFFVPDRASRLRQAPPVTDFDMTTPGPQVATTAEVSEYLADADALSRSRSEAASTLGVTTDFGPNNEASMRVVEEFFS